jgi:hypothetical protein
MLSEYLKVVSFLPAGRIPGWSTDGNTPSQQVDKPWHFSVEDERQTAAGKLFSVIGFLISP